MTSGTSRACAVLCSACLPILGSVAAEAAELGLDGFVRGQAADVASPVPWIEAGFGKVVDGEAAAASAGASEDVDAKRLLAELRLHL